MTVVKGRVVEIGEYYHFKIGNRSKADYCPITLKRDNGDLIQVSVNIRTLLEKTYMINNRNGKSIQVGMIKPNIGDILEVDGIVYPSYNESILYQMKYVKRITRTVKLDNAQ